MRKFVISLAACLCLSIQLRAQQASALARETVETIRDLRAVGIPEHSDMNGPPAQVPALLRTLNRQLRTLIIDTLNDSTRHGVVSEGEIFAQLRAAGWQELPDQRWNAYGEILAIRFDYQLGEDPGILIVTTRLWIPCGADPDASIYVFQGHARRWQLLAAVDADYAAVGDDPGGLQYLLLPQDSSGNWYLAVANSPPSCRYELPPSVRYRLISQGASPDKLAVLLDERESLNPRFSPPFRLRAEFDWFSVTRGKIRKLDGEPSVAIARYSLTAGKLSRTSPIALTPEDFLEEWTQLGWDVAAQWSDAPASSDVQTWHEKLNRLAEDSTEFKAVYSCEPLNGADATWLLLLWVDRQLNPSTAEERFFVLVSKRLGAFYVDDMRSSRIPGCSSHPLPRSMDDLTLPGW